MSNINRLVDKNRTPRCPGGAKITTFSWNERRSSKRRAISFFRGGKCEFFTGWRLVVFAWKFRFLANEEFKSPSPLKTKPFFEVGPL